MVVHALVFKELQTVQLRVSLVVANHDAQAAAMSDTTEVRKELGALSALPFQLCEASRRNLLLPISVRHLANGLEPYDSASSQSTARAQDAGWPLGVIASSTNATSCMYCPVASVGFSRLLH
jgi:hypothetical protein